MFIIFQAGRALLFVAHGDARMLVVRISERGVLWVSKFVIGGSSNAYKFFVCKGLVIISQTSG